MRVGALPIYPSNALKYNLTWSMMTFMDESSGVIVAASYWDEQLRSSVSALTGVRQGAEVLARGMVIADSYEVRGLVRRTVAHRGAAVRLDRLQLESARLDAAIGFLVTVLMADLTRSESLCSAEVLIAGLEHGDRAHGVGHRAGGRQCRPRGGVPA